MPRDSDGLALEIKWAQNPLEALDVRAPSAALQRSGWSNSFFEPGMDLPSGEHFNWVFRALTGLGIDISRHGILEWDDEQNYEHPAAVLGSDAQIYISTQDSGPDEGGAVDPTGSSGSTRWTELLSAANIPDLPASKITSGTFNEARIPDLAASKVTSGTFNPARLAASGEEDQILTRTDTGMAWVDPSVAGAGGRTVLFDGDQEIGADGTEVQVTVTAFDAE